MIRWGSGRVGLGGAGEEGWRGNERESCLTRQVNASVGLSHPVEHTCGSTGWRRARQDRYLPPSERRGCARYVHAHRSMQRVNASPPSTSSRCQISSRMEASRNHWAGMVSRIRECKGLKNEPGQYEKLLPFLTALSLPHRRRNERALYAWRIKEVISAL